MRAQVTGCVAQYQYAVLIRRQTRRTLRLRFLTGGLTPSSPSSSSSRSFFFPLLDGAGATSMGEGVSNCSEPAADVEARGCMFVCDDVEERGDCELASRLSQSARKLQAERYTLYTGMTE